MPYSFYYKILKFESASALPPTFLSLTALRQPRVHQPDRRLQLVLFLLLLLLLLLDLYRLLLGNDLDALVPLRFQNRGEVHSIYILRGLWSVVHLPITSAHPRILQCILRLLWWFRLLKRPQQLHETALDVDVVLC